MTNSQQISWNRLVQQAEGLLCVSSNRISNAANLSALLFQELADISWVGFYFLHDTSTQEATCLACWTPFELSDLEKSFPNGFQGSASA